MKKARAVFLDRDGTLIHDAHYLSDPKQVRLYKDVPLGLRRLREAGYKLIIISNQSGIGRGWVSERSVHLINERMQKMILSKNGAKLDAVYFCPHAPWDACFCRKPEPGMIRQAKKKMDLDLKNSFMVGDKVIDILLAKKTGMRGVFMLTGHGPGEKDQFKKLEAKMRPDFTARRFSEAVKWILNA